MPTPSGSRHPILPPGLSAGQFEAVLSELTEIVGAEWVFSQAGDALDGYRDAYPVLDPNRLEPSAAICPADTAQIQAILKVANRYRLPLWTFSGRRNLGYGGAAPRVRGSVAVNLSRMNRILEVNAEAAYVVVEPGVTYQQLYDHLQSHKIDLWLSPPELGWASVMGNALEHGVGYTPMGDNFGFSCGMEVVLPDGDILRTGMGAMAKSNSWQLCKYGFGPVVDGLFTQSNFGIVTKLGMWLMPAPPAYRSYLIDFPRESDLHAIIEILRPLKLRQIVQNAGMVAPWTYEATLMGHKRNLYAGAGAIPDAVKQQIIDKLDIGWWNLYGAQYGTPAAMDEMWGAIKAAFSQIPGARFRFADQRPDLPGVKIRDMVSRGVPNMLTQEVLNWADNGAHVDFSPVSPSTGQDATDLYRLMKSEFEAVGMDYIGAFIIGWREMHNIALMIYDKTKPQERQRAHRLFGDLIAKAAERGYGEYRTHLAFMDQVAASYDFNDNAMLRFTQRLKDALDPNGILSPGKQGIWPSGIRADAIAPEAAE